jgi:hypothetical protein
MGEGEYGCACGDGDCWGLYEKSNMWDRGLVVGIDCSLKTGGRIPCALSLPSGSTFTLIFIGFLLLPPLLMSVAGELVASGKLMPGPGDCIISSSSLNFGFFVLANCGEEDLSGSLYACC